MTSSFMSTCAAFGISRSMLICVLAIVTPRVGGEWFLREWWLRAERSEPLAHLADEHLRLLPRSEVPALVELAEIDQFGIRALCPAPRGCVDLIGEDGDRNRDRDVLGIEEARLRRQSIFPIQAGRRDGGIGQPVHGDVVEDVVAAQAFALSVEDARDQRVTARIVVEDPRCQANG